VLSISLRSLLLLALSSTARSVFFNRVQSSGANRFVQRVAQHAALAAHLRYALALIQQRLHALLHRRCEHVGRTSARLPEEPRCPLLPIQLQVALHGRQRHAERTHDIALPHRLVVDQLAGEQAEALEILLLVRKHGQQSVEIHHPARLSLKRQVLANQGQAVGKDRQLQLRHGPVSLLLAVPGKHPDRHQLGRVIFLDSPKSLHEIRSSESRPCKPRARATVPSMGCISLDERSQPGPVTATVAKPQGVAARRS